MENIETIIFEIISNGGTAKGLIYEAIEASGKGEFEQANQLLKEADEYLLAAHKIQTEMIVEETRGNHIEVQVLFVHAQDHLMTALEVRSLADVLIGMNKKIHQLSK
ncbi:MAG: PTS lactose/cellobiose transporter subunit IIA [Erysipelotrichaceae bacterium]|nr:PTS lactose/cellobiose transporter subunit IIA [Erysipelotrichaceae bacterium]